MPLFARGGHLKLNVLFVNYSALRPFFARGGHLGGKKYSLLNKIHLNFGLDKLFLIATIIGISRVVSILTSVRYYLVIFISEINLKWNVVHSKALICIELSTKLIWLRVNKKGWEFWCTVPCLRPELAGTIKFYSPPSYLVNGSPDNSKL